jgi:V8-like Glu-specific endopeptidase
MRRRRFLTIAVSAAAMLGLTASAVASPAAAASAGRQSRSSHLAIAGADVYLWSSHRSDRSGGACTLAFSVRTASGHTGALTAGHCLELLRGGPSYTVHQTRYGKGNTSDVGDVLGSVTRGESHAGGDGDNAFVALAGGSQAEPSVFTGRRATKTAATVVGHRSVHDGQSHVCFSGAISGEHCGLVVRGPARTITFHQDGRTLRIAHERTAYGSCSARPGDSGAPVYVRHGSSVWAIGILSGGGTVNGQCVTLFTPLSLALRHLHVSLLTRS